MPQTELKVVRCPNCNTAYNAASLPPGKGFRCKKCSTVVGGSAPAAAEEPAAPAKKGPSSRIDRKASGSTSRRVKPDSGRASERAERPSSQRIRGGAPQQKSPMIWIVGGVLGVAIIGLMVAKMGGDEPKSQPKKTEEPKVEKPVVERPREPDPLDNDTTGHLTDWAKERGKGFNGQDKNKIDPNDPGAGATPPQEPPKEEPPKEPPKDHDPLDDDKPPDHKDN